MKKVLPILLAVMAGVSLLAARTPQSPPDTLLSMLPASGIGEEWSMPDSARIYVGNKLYLFIDGGADLFVEYGFRRALAAEFRKDEGESINLEVYEMTDAGAAFGIYSVRSGRETEPIGLGQGGSAHPYYIMFWKGRFYVSVAASDSSAECRKGMEAIALAVDRKLAGEGQKPLLMKSLPADDLLEELYFRGYLGLSSVRLLDMPEMFPAIDGAVGAYADHEMIVLNYSGESEARQRLAAVMGRLSVDARYKRYERNGDIASVTDGRNRTICAGRSGQHIVLSVSQSAAVAESACRKAIAAVSR
jgi:hypothetical protein